MPSAQIKEMSFHKVLTAIDDDPIAAHAAEVGMDLARSVDAQVALIHAVDPSLIFAPEAGVATDELALRAEQDGTRLMADFRERLPTGTHVQQFIPQGPPGAEIVKAAREWEADLIVIGSHGRRAPREPWLVALRRQSCARHPVRSSLSEPRNERPKRGRERAYWASLVGGGCSPGRRFNRPFCR